MGPKRLGLTYGSNQQNEKYIYLIRREVASEQFTTGPDQGSRPAGLEEGAQARWGKGGGELQGTIAEGEGCR